MAKRGLLLLGAGAVALFAFSSSKKKRIEGATKGEDKFEEEEKEEEEKEEKEEEEKEDPSNKEPSKEKPSKEKPQKLTPSPSAPLRYDRNVQVLQMQLVKVSEFFGYPEWNPGAPDGKLGPNTISAIKKFQQTNGLTPTGAMDSDTLDALEIWSEGMELFKSENRKPSPGTVVIGTLTAMLPSSRPSNRPKGGNHLKFPPLTVKGEIPFWSTIQEALKELEYNPGKVDGIFGRNTSRALKAFQTDWSTWVSWLRNNHDPYPRSGEFYKVTANGKWSDKMTWPFDEALSMNRSGEIHVMNKLVAYDWQSLLKFAKANPKIGEKIKAITPSGGVSPSMDPSNAPTQNKPPFEGGKYVGSLSSWVWPHGEKIGYYEQDVAKTLGNLSPDYYNKLSESNFRLTPPLGMSAVEQFQTDWNRIQKYAESNPLLGPFIVGTFGYRLAQDGKMGYHSCIALSQAVDVNRSKESWTTLVDDAKRAGF